MNSSQANPQLVSALQSLQISTIADVIAAMEAMDSLLPSTDGLKWFNLLYLDVTRKVDTAPPPGGWHDAQWLTRLDVVFAKLYFGAVLGWLTGASGVPDSWQALFEARFSAGIERIQFALAGMNAHINHDLALALLQTDAEMNLTPAKDGGEHGDYENVNGLLEAVLPQALTLLANGILGQAAEDSGAVGRFLAIWNVRAARDLAWDVSDNLRPLAGAARAVYLASQDQITGVLGRSLLL
jgi:hypothetical protein